MNGRVDSRFEITHNDLGLIDTFRNYDEAILVAFVKLQDPLYEGIDYFHVFDVMAHYGNTELWRITIDSNGDPVVEPLQKRKENENGRNEKG